MTAAFGVETVAFLTDLRANNDKAWFDANRDRYRSAYVDPAVAFVASIGPKLDRIVPGINADPKVLGSIFRVNRDTRFSADKTPYKDHLDMWFWEGDRKSAVSSLFLRVAPQHVVVGAGAHGFSPDQLGRYRGAVDADLAAIVAKLEHAGHEIGGETYARTPKGFDGDERLLRQRGLNVSTTLPIDVPVATLLARWRTYAPLHRWLERAIRTG